MSETTKLKVCIFNQENGAVLRAECISLSTTSMEKTLKKQGVKITNVAMDAYGLCIQTKTYDNAKVVKDFIDNKKN